MILGVPKEIKDQENRVALLPEAVRVLVREGHRVLVQKRAGLGAGFSDEEFRRAGARLIPTIREIYRKSELVVKVKEPMPAEYPLFRPGLRLFCYLHLAANPRLTKAIQKSGVTALGFETLEDSEGRTPLLKPMSEIAGRLSVILGAQFLQKKYGGRGVLLPGTHFSPPGRVVIVGGGSVGWAAAEVGLGLGAKVWVLDIKSERLRGWAAKYANCEVLPSSPQRLGKLMRNADLVVGAVYVHGAKTPQVIRKEMVRAMPPGSVLMDVAVDQGGASETTRPTSISKPIYLRYGVVHCAVTNMPALVSRTASQALSRTILPYVQRLAAMKSEESLAEDEELFSALNIRGGEIILPSIRRKGGRQ